MHYLDLTLPTPEENLALDEALLEEADADPCAGETLRLWEPTRTLVAVGRSSKIAEEVRVDACRAASVPVLRRTSGGCAIVAGPGCLMYALVLSYDLRPEIRMVDHAHRFVLATMIAALGPLAPGIACRGISDLAVGDRKCSGNSIRSKRRRLLYHGTLLYDFPLDAIERYLGMPERQPAYRAGRDHAAFVMNLPLAGEAIRRALVSAWQADDIRTDWPRQRVAQLVAQRYSRPEWNEAIG